MDRKKTLITVLVVLLVLFMNIDGNTPLYHCEVQNDTVIYRNNILLAMETDTLAVEDSVDIEEIRDVPMAVARILDKDLIISTEGKPLDEVLIRKTIQDVAIRRTDTIKRTFEKNNIENMAYFNIADDWAQIISFKRRDDKYLVFLVQYYDWAEGYGVINTNYFIFDGETLVSTPNPLKKFPYLSKNKDTIGVRYDFRTIKQEYVCNRLKLNTAAQDIEHQKVDDVINAEFLWTGRDFIELASDHSVPHKGDLQKIWEGALGTSIDMPNQYARIDFDSDGNDEYIFRINDGTDTHFAIFSYIDDKLSLVAGNNGAADKDIKIYQGGFVVIADKQQTRHIKLMASVVEATYVAKDGKFSFRQGKSGSFTDMEEGDYKKAIRRARRQVEFSHLDWRPWSLETAR